MTFKLVDKLDSPADEPAEAIVPSVAADDPLAGPAAMMPVRSEETLEAGVDCAETQVEAIKSIESVLKDFILLLPPKTVLMSLPFF
jgi:hypothetical protein